MRNNPIRMVIRRIVAETRLPFFVVESWPISEIVKWMAHFSIEHEEFQKMKDKSGGKKNKTTYITNKESSVEDKNAAVMLIF